MARKLSPFQDQPPLLLGGSLFLLLQGIRTGAEDFRVKESRFVFFSPAARGEAEAGAGSGLAAGLGAEDGSLAPGEAAAAALRGLPEAAASEARSGAAASWDTAAGSAVVTVRYCSSSSFGEVAGFSCSRDLARPGEEARTAGAEAEARETWGSSLGGLSSTSGPGPLVPGTQGLRTLMGGPSTLAGILFISFSVILVGDLEFCIRDEVILWRPHGSPGWPRLLARGSLADPRPGLESDFWGMWNVGTEAEEAEEEAEVMPAEDARTGGGLESWSRNWKLGLGTRSGVTRLPDLAPGLATALLCDLTTSFQSFGLLMTCWRSLEAGLPALLRTVTVTMGDTAASLVLRLLGMLRMLFILASLAALSSLSLSLSRKLLKTAWQLVSRSGEGGGGTSTWFTMTGEAASLLSCSWRPWLRILVMLVVVAVEAVSTVWGRLPWLDTGVGSTVATRLELEAEMGPTTCSREQSEQRHGCKSICSECSFYRRRSS